RSLVVTGSQAHCRRPSSCRSKEQKSSCADANGQYQAQGSDQQTTCMQSLPCPSAVVSPGQKPPELRQRSGPAFSFPSPAYFATRSTASAVLKFKSVVCAKSRSLASHGTPWPHN